MTLSAQEKADLARWRMNKADGLLRDAQTLLAAHSWASSANRSYYGDEDRSAFHGVRRDPHVVQWTRAHRRTQHMAPLSSIAPVP